VLFDSLIRSSIVIDYIYIFNYNVFGGKMLEGLSLERLLRQRDESNDEKFIENIDEQIKGRQEPLSYWVDQFLFLNYNSDSYKKELPIKIIEEKIFEEAKTPEDFMEVYVRILFSLTYCYKKRSILLKETGNRCLHEMKEKIPEKEFHSLFLKKKKDFFNGSL